MKKKRRPITLLEIMIVILLIGVIGGVLSYNLKGTLSRGKEFRTKEGLKRLQEILDLEIERGAATPISLVGPANSDRVKACVQQSGFIADSNLDDFLQDGWKKPYHIQLSSDGKSVVVSVAL